MGSVESFRSCVRQASDIATRWLDSGRSPIYDFNCILSLTRSIEKLHLHGGNLSTIEIELKDIWNNTSCPISLFAQWLAHHIEKDESMSSVNCYISVCALPCVPKAIVMEEAFMCLVNRIHGISSDTVYVCIEQGREIIDHKSEGSSDHRIVADSPIIHVFAKFVSLNFVDLLENCTTVVLNKVVEALFSIAYVESLCEQMDFQTYHFIFDFANARDRDEIVIPMIFKQMFFIIFGRSLNEDVIRFPGQSRNIIEKTRCDCTAFLKRLVVCASTATFELHAAVLARNLLVKSVGKENYHENLVHSVVDIMSACGYETNLEFSNFLSNTSKFDSPSLRLLTLYTTFALFNTMRSVEWASSSTSCVSCTCLRVIFERISDKNSCIRGKAVKYFTSISEEALHHVENIIFVKENSQEMLKNQSKEVFDAKALFKTLFKRMQDRSAYIRKSVLRALSLLVNVMLFIESKFDATNLSCLLCNPLLVSMINLRDGNSKVLYISVIKSFVSAMNDSSLCVRRQAIELFTKEVISFDSNLKFRIELLSMWLHSVPKLIKDDEDSVREAVCSSFSNVFFDEFSFFIESRNEPNERFLAVLKLVGSAPYHFFNDFSQIFNFMAQRKKLYAGCTGHIETLIKKLGNQHSHQRCACWLLLSQCAMHFPTSLSVEFVLLQFDALAQKIDSSNEGSIAHEFDYVLSTVRTISQLFQRNQLKGILQNIMAQLDGMAPTHAIKPLIQTMIKLSCPLFDDKDSHQKYILNWASEILSTNVFKLKSFTSDLENWRLFLDRRGQSMEMNLQMIGTVVLLFPQLFENSYIEMLRVLITFSAIVSESSTSESHQIPLNIRAHAFSCLGKFCLIDESIAKENLGFFVRALLTKDKSNQCEDVDNSSAVIRNNIIIILSDLCMRYGTLMDQHILSISMCLRDPSELVRISALQLLSSLLWHDHVKWKGPIIFRFMTLLTDESQDVRALAHAKLDKILYSANLQKKMRNTSAHLVFIETIFYLNNCTDHNSYRQFLGHKESVHIYSEIVFTDRFSHLHNKNLIYKFLLKRMSLDEKIALQGTICSDVLKYSCENSALPLSRAHELVITDCLSILASEELSECVNDIKNIDVHGSDPVNNALSISKMRSKISGTSKSMQEIVLPVLRMVKQFLSKNKSKIADVATECLALLSHADTVYYNGYDLAYLDRTLASEMKYLVSTHKYSRNVSQI